MVDWITAQIEAMDPYRRERLFNTGRIEKVSPEAEITESFASRLVSEGSFSSSLTFRAPYAHALEMSGNPAKFLQGHNLFGSDDYMGLFFEGAMRASKYGAFIPSPDLYHELKFTAPRFTRLDLTRSYRFESNAQANAWIKGVAGSAHTRHRNKISTNGTVYYGKTSTRWAFKIYNKFDEITSGKKGHKIKEGLGHFGPMTEQQFFDTPLNAWAVHELHEWAEGVVRFELTIRPKEIAKYTTDNYSETGGFLKYSPERIWHDYFKKIQFNRNGELVSVPVEKYPQNLRNALLLWKGENDLRSLYSKSTFYRLRRECAELGIDLDESPKAHEAFSMPLELVSSKWDPAPIPALMFEPDPEILCDFGLQDLDLYAS